MTFGRQPLSKEEGVVSNVNNVVDNGRIVQIGARSESKDIFSSSAGVTDDDKDKGKFALSDSLFNSLAVLAVACNFC